MAAFVQVPNISLYLKGKLIKFKAFTYSPKPCLKETAYFIICDQKTNDLLILHFCTTKYIGHSKHHWD